MVSRARTVTFAGVVSPGLSLFPLRRGPRDPCFQVGDDGAIWRTSLLGSGSVTARISRVASDAVECTAWGSGAEEFLDVLPAMLGAHDDASDFAPSDPTVAAAHRRVPHLRLGSHRSGIGSPDSGGHRAAGTGRRRIPGMAVAGEQIRHAGAGARAGADAGAAVGRRVAAHPVVGISSCQRRPGTGPDDRQLRPAGAVVWNGWRHGRPRRPETR